VLRVVINGTPHLCQPGGSILAALEQADVRVPTLCHDDRLVPTGACRSCLVHIEGHDRLVTACSTPLADGMVIVTDTEELVEHRRSLLAVLAARYPIAATTLQPDKPFHRELREYGIQASGDVTGDHDLEDRSHPYIAVDMARCIDCYRCVRICDEVQGQGVWHVRNRGRETRIVPDGPTLLDSSCVGCGACVDTCPTGALDDVDIDVAADGSLSAADSAAAGSTRLPMTWTRTTCPYCGTGCEMQLGTREGRIVASRPVLDAPVSKGHLCVKGRYAFDFVSADDRITEPMIRDGERWRRVSWSEARAVVVSRLRALIDRYGPDCIGLLGSARATNEDNYLVQKFARVVIGTNNVDCCARVCHAPSAVGLKRMLGSGLTTNSFDDIEAAACILVCGANPTENHPIVGARIRQAARRGTPLIVIDPRRIELASEATSHLAITPGTTIPLLNAMAHTIVIERLWDASYLEHRVDGREDFARFIAEWPPERASGLCHVSADAIRAAARLYASHGPAMIVHGLGVTEHVQGADGVMALINLALLTGNIGRTGGGVNPLRGQNNVQGAAHMGCEPRSLPGSTSIDLGRDDFERVWGRPIPRTRGRHLLEMMDAAEEGRLKALWTVGYDVLLTNPNASATLRALQALELVIVQDLFLTETARQCASVFLPACSSFEKDGTFMNAERRIQRVRAALRPLGASKPDWQIFAETARAMGAQGFEYGSAVEIWDEIRVLCSGARGMTYDRLDVAGLQWPCPSEDHPGTTVLHRDTFAAGPRVSLRPIEFHPSPEATTADYPLMLITGRTLYQFNAGTMTGRTRNNLLRATDVLDISPDDASAVGLSEGDPVRVVSAYGSAVLPAHLSHEVEPGQLFATFHTPAFFLNALTGPHRDALTGTPEYKVTAVRLERAGS
jgi:formate dehydrogenase major subunit